MHLNKLTSPFMTVSIVSHMHGAQLMSLLCKLEALRTVHLEHVVLTVNVPEPALLAELNSRKWTLNLRIVQNTEPKGFGANHNAAFEYCDSEHFCVLNPDIEFTSDPFAHLVEALSADKVGLAYPSQVDGGNALLDFERELVSPFAIAQRHLLGQRYQPQPHKPVHWVSGAFMVFKSSVFRELGGFDERYFMYCEDVDICLRMQLAGYRLARADAKVIHHTRRSTLKSPGHLAWHVRSLLRLWSSESYLEYRWKFVDRRR